MESSKKVTRKTSNIIRTIVIVLAFCAAAASLAISVILLGQISQLNGDIKNLNGNITQLNSDSERLRGGLEQQSSDTAQLKGRIEQIEEKEVKVIPVFTAAEQPALYFNYNDRQKDYYNGYIQINCSDKEGRYVVMAKVSMLFKGIAVNTEQEYSFGGIVGGKGNLYINGNGKKGALKDPECKVEIMGYIKLEDYKN